MQEAVDADVVQEYGQNEPTFGGVYFEGEVVVALFTADLEHHAGQLRPRLLAPDQFRIELADRSYAEIEAANGRVQRRLMLGDRRHPDVFGVGIGMRHGRFVVQVAVENLNDRLAAEIEAAVAPDAVIITQSGRPRRN